METSTIRTLYSQMTFTIADNHVMVMGHLRLGSGCTLARNQPFYFKLPCDSVAINLLSNLSNASNQVCGWAMPQSNVPNCLVSVVHASQPDTSAGSVVPLNPGPKPAMSHIREKRPSETKLEPRDGHTMPCARLKSWKRCVHGVSLVRPLAC